MKIKRIISLFLVTFCVWLYGCSGEQDDVAHLDPQQVVTLPVVIPAGEVPTVAHDITVRELELLFNHGKPIPGFFARTLKALQQCTQWAEPEAPDEMAQSWYRAATTLHALKLKTAERYRQMLILYEAAARRGHYRAALHLTALYTTGGLYGRGGLNLNP